jgi:hypothetical protein
MKLNESDIQSFLSSLQSTDNNDDILNTALDRAALSGAFDLHALTSFAPEQDQIELRTQLLALTETHLNQDDRLLYWLSQSQRSRSLTKLINDTELLQKTMRDSPLSKDDVVGHELRRILMEHQTVQPAQMAGARLSALIQALGLLVAAGLPYDELRRKAVLEQRKQSQFHSYQGLLANGLFGREQVLKQINDYIHDVERKERFLFISGIGGSGKSALIAHLIQSFSDPNRKTECLVFDFDRPLLDTRGPGLTLELTQQLALLRPELDAELQEIRHHIRQTYNAGGGGSMNHSKLNESSQRSSDNASWMLRDLVQRSGLSEVPIVVLFDTLEVLSRQGGDALRSMTHWISEVLPYDIGLQVVGTIIAGRAADTFAKQVYWNVQTLILPSLPLAGAVLLLQQIGLTRRRAFKAARVLGGNPLVLRLGGRYLHEHPKLAVRELMPGGSGDVALTQGILYQRILRHVGTGVDDPLRQVAYPGLALRYITRGILTGVILPALRMPLSDPIKIDKLWRELVSHTWLVERETDRLVRHRADLREMMIQLVSRDAEIAVSVRCLHQWAVKYYDPGNNDPDIPADRARLEQVYHRLMLLDLDEDLPAGDHELVSTCLVGDLNGLSPHAAAVARLHSKQPLQTGDHALLPVQYREVALAELGWAALERDRAEEAIQLLPELLPSPTVWYLTAKQDTADWQSNEVTAILGHVHSEGQLISPADSEQLLFASRGRENRSNLKCTAAFLHLWRREFGYIDDPTKEIGLGKIKFISEDEQMSAFKRCAVYWVSVLLSCGKDEPDLGRLQLVVEDNKNRGERLNVAIEDELARLRLLLWRVGRLKPSRQIGLTASMIAASPQRLIQFESLIGRSIRRRFDNEYGQGKKSLTTAQLTGQIANDIARQIVDLELDTVENLSKHGFISSDFSSGVWAELRPAARTLLRNLLRHRAVIEPFSQGLERSLIAANDPDRFIPYDLQPEQWLRAALGGGASKAITSLVDWAGRTGRLSHVIALAACFTCDQVEKFNNLWSAQAMLDDILIPQTPDMRVERFSSMWAAQTMYSDLAIPININT